VQNFGRAKGGGRRKAPRSPAPILATLSTITNDYRVELINLSSTGARLSGRALPAEGEEVIFKADRVQSFGLVVWSYDGQCGVGFDDAISAAEMERLRHDANIFGKIDMSAGDIAAAEEWQRGTAR
jgi:hypothetical protein